jgi:hypothetical protein
VATYDYDLGAYHRAVTTTSPEAQLWFDRGMVWCYGYNHEEAVRCFELAASADPDCAMAHWGIAYAAGPNYNKQWKAFDPADLKRSLDTASTATQRALSLRTKASRVEQSLIEPLAARYPSADPAAVTPIWNDSYAAAMRQVYRDHPDDLDVVALFAEAIMNRTPWQLWNTRGLRSAEKFTGTGLASPNRNGEWDSSSIAGRITVPKGSMCFAGLKLTRPRFQAVLSPRR